MSTILHVVHASAWVRALRLGIYRADSLLGEGFIHCCEPKQLPEVLDRWFEGEADLLVLEIDVEQLESPIRWETAAHDKYPHIYGSLNLDAVIRVARPERKDGAVVLV